MFERRLERSERDEETFEACTASLAWNLQRPDEDHRLLFGNLTSHRHGEIDDEGTDSD